MKLEDFKVGQRVAKIAGAQKGIVGTVVSVAKDGEVRVEAGSGNDFWIKNRPYNWALVQPEPAQVTDWSYAEAQRLAAAADAAIDQYNEYIASKPSTVFIAKIK